MKLSEFSHREANELIKYIISSSKNEFVAQFSNRTDPFPKQGWDEVERRLKTGKRTTLFRFMRSKYLMDFLLLDNRDFREFMEPMDVSFNVDHMV